MIKYATDSRKVKQGQVFVAIKGHTVDGHKYINDAIKNGAIAIVGEEDLKLDVPYTKVKSSEEYLKNTIIKEYAKTLEDLVIVGITGTNGKTTTSYITYQMLKALNVKVAYLGTIGFYYEDEVVTLENTTPDILTLYELLLNVKEKGCTHIIMEVSSHSLYYERIAGLKLQIAAFTNLTEDHLDFHKTMENYLNEKLKIINYLKKDSTFIANNDDKAAPKFLEKWSNNLTLGLNGDIKINNYKITPAETTLNFSYKDSEYTVTYNLTSKFNIYNYLTALAIAMSLGFKIDEILDITPKIKAPVGRCETYKVKNAYVVIDYAHTPDAVEKIIDAYQELKENKVITIIGCGGDRDPIKRPIMGEIATNKSDFVILTNDNPRTEDPKAIMADILKGIKKNNYKVIYDRKEAIKEALDMLENKDILLILGKGHEDYQIIGHEKIHLSDKEEVLKYSENKK